MERLHVHAMTFIKCRPAHVPSHEACQSQAHWRPSQACIGVIAHVKEVMPRRRPKARGCANVPALRHDDDAAFPMHDAVRVPMAADLPDALGRVVSEEAFTAEDN